MSKQPELFKPDFGFFTIFRELIKSGTWARLSMSAKSIYPVIRSYVNVDNGAAFPSLDTLAAKAGISRVSVSKALNELAEQNLLSAKKTPGKSTVYALIDTFSVRHPISKNEMTATAQYVPRQVTAVVEELKSFIATGAKGQIIQINLNLNTGAGNQTNNNNIDGGEAIQRILALLDQKEPVDKPVDNP